MSKPIDVISENSRILIKYNGIYLSLIKTQSGDMDKGYYFVAFPFESSPSSEANILLFDIKMGSINNKLCICLSSTRAYQNKLASQKLCFTDFNVHNTGSSTEAYGFPKDVDKPAAKLILEPVGHGRYRIYEEEEKINGSFSKYYLYVTGASTADKSTFLKRTDNAQSASIFDIEVLDKPDLVFPENGDSFEISPQENNNSYWLTGESIPQRQKNNTTFDAHNPTELDFGVIDTNGAMTIYFYIRDDDYRNGWRFANSQEKPTKAIMLGNIHDKSGISLIGNDSLVSEIESDGKLKVTIPHGINSAWSFVFRAVKTTNSIGNCYCSKDPTATRREPH